MFSFQAEGPAGGKIFLRGECVAEIRDLRLANLRCAPGGRILVGESVPLPLYWQQYANHEDPERNAGSEPQLRLLAEGEELKLLCEGNNRSRAMHSSCILGIREDPAAGRIAYDVDAELAIPEGAVWSVTPNPSHGEIGFCDLWPEGAFVTDRKARKFYSACIIQRAGRLTRLRHVHADTPARENIRLSAGDRFGWVLEDENPVVEILGTENISAGLCAYMWDAHFGLRAAGSEGIELRGPRTFRARYRLFSFTRGEAEAWMSAAIDAEEPELATMPLIEEGTNGFSRSMADAPSDAWWSWPWTVERMGGDRDAVRFARDSRIGRADRHSLRIECGEGGAGRWSATALGPAFGGGELIDGSRYRLAGHVRIDSLRAVARLAIRLHREGAEGLFDPSSYEIFYSERAADPERWRRLEVVTPPINPPPDRLHLLLELTGSGCAWFDDVEWEQLPPRVA